MGGFHEVLIDHEHRPVFSQTNIHSDGFDLAVTHVKYIRGRGEEVMKQRHTGPQPKVLKSSALGQFLVIRIPTHHAQPATPTTQEAKLQQGLERVSLCRHLANKLHTGHNSLNGTSAMVVSIPAITVIATHERTDNPLWSQGESGQSYQPTAPISRAGGPSVGFSFM
ncbi:hypothetical protein HOY80DRAFT_996708 [Tuber brumale]|nr:hypothetical protein HOY80DRAFT_996708 [Tuber brumale]